MQKYVVAKRVLWGFIGLSVIVGAGTIAVMSGVTQPYIAHHPPSQALPVLGAAVGMIVVGGFMLRFVDAWHWEAVGGHVDLTPAEDGLPRRGLSHHDDALIGKSILTGTIRGRPVRARVLTKKRDRDDSNSGSRTYTLVEADLREPAEEGALVSRGDASLAFEVGAADDSPNMSDHFGDLTDLQEDPFFGQTTAEPLLRAVLAGRARRHLLELETFGLLHVGNSEEVYTELFSSFMSEIRDAMPEVAGFAVGAMFPSGRDVAERMDHGDQATVTHRLEEVLLDPEELERQVNAAVAVADAYERAKSGPQDS